MPISHRLRLITNAILQIIICCTSKWQSIADAGTRHTRTALRGKFSPVPKRDPCLTYLTFKSPNLSYTTTPSHSQQPRIFHQHRQNGVRRPRPHHHQPIRAPPKQIPPAPLPRRNAHSPRYALTHPSYPLRPRHPSLNRRTLTNTQRKHSTSTPSTSATSPPTQSTSPPSSATLPPRTPTPASSACRSSSPYR